MPTQQGLIEVRFHGGFLDGRVSQGDASDTSAGLDFWSPELIYAITGGEVGAVVHGVSPFEDQPVDAAWSGYTQTVVMEHAYRVTASRHENGALVLDVTHELTSSC